jgi:NAD(P)-dependent dehydrogenase (short-subunit alcohol dehydrogenase family)
MMKLRNRTCIVTGATRGLGRQLAETFWREGASLFLAGRNATALRSLAESLQTSGHRGQKLVVHSSDLSVPWAAAALISKAVAEFGAVTALVNNAAILGPIGPLWENDLALWEETIRVDLLAPAALCALVIPLMQKQGYGKIVNLSGGGATSPRPHFSAYSTAKVGLVRLTEILAHETRSMHIDINCIAPGIMSTAMLEKIKAAGPKRAGNAEFAQVQRHQGESTEGIERAARLAEFLVSGDSDGISGRLISAVWDPWEGLAHRRDLLCETDIYTLRRIVPKDRGFDWDAL